MRRVFRKLGGLAATFGLIAAIGLAILTPAHAQDATAATAPRAPRETAALIRDLMAGTLSPDIDPQDLFRADLGAPDAARTKVLLGLIGDPKRLKQARQSPGSLDGVTPEEAVLIVAQAEFLTLPPARRDALLTEHRDRAKALKAAQAQTDRKKEMLARLDSRAMDLQSYMDRKPSDRDALAIDLLDPDEVAQNADRRQTLTHPPETVSRPGRQANESLDDQIVAVTARIDRLRAQILALPDAQRVERASLKTREQAELSARAEARKAAERAANLAQQAAERARREAAAAAAAAESANSETERLVETERSRLLATKQAQADFAASLAHRGDIARQLQERALGWRRRVMELQQRSRLDPIRKLDADQLYFELVDDLRHIRGDLNRALGRGAGKASLDPPKLAPILLRDQPLAAPLVALRDQLVKGAIRLRERDEAMRWNERGALKDAMDAMNDIRLSLIPDLSPPTRAQIIGFGEAGIAQAGREVDQILLTLRYNFQYLPQHVDEALNPFLHPTPQLVFGLLQLLLIALIFRYWRRRGDGVLGNAERAYLRQRPPTVMSAALAASLRYARQVRRPLDWFALLVLLYWAWPPEIQIAGLDYVWTIAFWLLAAAFLVQLLDALAQGRRRDDPRAQLRQRSLRLVIGVVILVGLTLSLTAETVGVGAIYHWVFSACWLLMIPVGLVLASWWRERITTLAESGAAAHPILAWCVRNQDGATGHLTRIIAGAVLLVEGTRGVLIRRANDIVLIREIVDQRARIRAAQRAAADEASGRFRPLTVDRARALASTLMAELDPRRPPDSLNTYGPAAKCPSPELSPGALVAIIGERGLGKTTALARFTRDLPDSDLVRIRLTDGSFDAVLAALGQELGVKDATETAIIAAFAARPFSIVAIDDVQRLIVPAIGGLADFDRLVALARALDGVSWLFAIGGPAWGYLSRARGDRALFDQVIILPRWDPTELRGLIERRTNQAGLEPVFDRLERVDAINFDGDVSPRERVKRAYFSGLADYCDGNPGVALEFWRRSLFEDTLTQQLTVRTFAPPLGKALMDMPQMTFFVLRAILQTEIAGPDAIQRSTDLPAPLIADALRGLARHGVIMPVGRGYRVSLFWYREVVRQLERQNLLVRSAE